MAYVGQKPATTLTMPTSQYFNGDGSTTAFTLNKSVTVGEELEVFVDNVQQEPGAGKSYTATGTTLTFDAAPSSGTGNVYVVYRGLSQFNARLEHDPNAALAATTGTFSGDLTVDTNTLYVDSTNNRVGIGTTGPQAPLDITGSPAGEHGAFIYNSNASGYSAVRLGNSDRGSNGDHLIYGSSAMGIRSKTGANITFEPAGTVRMTIDTSGRVTKPYQPAFFVKDLNFPGSNSAGTASGGTVLVNVGSHYATGTGRFTAPIAGTYVFYVMTQAFDSGNTSGQYQTAIFRKNGATFGAECYHGWQPNDGNNHVQAQNTVMATLAANDYVQAYVVYGSRDIQNYFGGYLLG